MRRVAALSGVFVLLLLGGALFPIRAAAGPNANAKIVLHMLSPTLEQWRMCERRLTCSSIATAGALYPGATYFAMLLVMDGNATAGIASLRFGIDYDAAPASGVEVWAWICCADMEAQAPGPNGVWPSAGSSNTITWLASTNCQRSEPGGAGTGAVANAGYFYVGAYTPDTFAATPAGPHGVATVASCAAVLDTVAGGNFVGPSHLGFVRFSAGGVEPGYNPCGLNTPVQAMTWSGIKSTYR